MEIKIKTLLMIAMIIIMNTSASNGIFINSTIAYDSYTAATNEIKTMQKRGLPTLPLIDMLSQAEGYYNAEKFNSSYATTESIIAKSKEIYQISTDIDRLNDENNLLKSYIPSSTEIDMALLLARTEFESANIEAAKKRAIDISDKNLLLLKNISSTKNNELETYKESLRSPPAWFLSFYEDEQTEYDKRQYYLYLKEFRDFDDIKQIISLTLSHDRLQKELKKKNMSLRRVSDMLQIFSEQINSSEYSLAKETIKSINSVEETAIALSAEFKSLESEIERLQGIGISDNETLAMLNKAKDEYELENMEQSKKLNEEIKTRIRELETQNIILGGINKASLKKGFKDFLIKSWPYILSFVILALISYNPAKSYIQLKVHRKKLEGCKYEKEAIGALQIDLQKQYYEDKIIDKETYKSDFSGYEDRKAELSNEISLYEEKIKEDEQEVKKIQDKLDAIQNKIFRTKSSEIKEGMKQENR